MEKVDDIISLKKTLVKNSIDVHEVDKLFEELDGFEWLRRQTTRY